MTPTQRLRFVKRKIYEDEPVSSAHGDFGTFSHLVIETILQQWWESDAVDYKTFELSGEWRDVPLEEE